MSNTELQSLTLNEENLIPLYLIEDKLKDNFRKTNVFINNTNRNHSHTSTKMKQLKKQQDQMKQSFQQKMQIMKKDIVHQISNQLQGRIAVALGKSIQSFTEKLDKREAQMSNFKEGFESKLKEVKESVKYEVTQENQKVFAKEVKKIKQSIKQMPASNNLPTTRKLPSAKVSGGQQSGWQSQHVLIKQLEQKLQKIQAFNVDLDKRFYTNMTSLKDSWKQLGTELLQNKKSLNRKFDDMRVEFIKLKNLKQFSIVPEKVEDEFKKKLTQKFTDIYQLLGITLTKNQFESSTQRMNKRINRHDEQFMDVRKQLGNNSQFFTFYMNNSDQEDLKKQIVLMQSNLNQQTQSMDKQSDQLKQMQAKTLDKIHSLQKNLVKNEQNLVNGNVQIIKMKEIVNLFQSRIENLEDFNRFGPDKLQKIHNALDGGFSASQKQLIHNQNKKNNNQNLQQIQRDFKIQLSKIKDEMFILGSQTQIKQQEISALKKILAQMDGKIERFKGQTEEAMISRKPWVCLSCDKQENAKKELKVKKVQSIRQGGFGHQKGSQKNLKLGNQVPFEQRFEVYQKFRQKYLSDTVKLPEIYKQKIGDKDSSFH